MKISERPEFKSKKPPLTFKENDSVFNAVKSMAKDNFGSVVIVDDKRNVRGIVTERDLMRKVIPNSMNPKTTKLKDIIVLESNVNEQIRNVIEPNGSANS